MFILVSLQSTYWTSYNWTFSLGLTAEALGANIDWKLQFCWMMRSLWPKISGRRGRPYKPFLCVIELTRLINLSYGIRILAEVAFVLSQCTCLADSRTDWQMLIAIPRLRSGSAVKIDWDYAQNRPQLGNLHTGSYCQQDAQIKRLHL